MNIDYDEYWEEYMMLLCLFKVLKDTGNEFWEFDSEMIVINESDYYFQYCIDALNCAAPIIEKSESLYHKHGYKCSYDDDVDITAYSSKEMQQCFKIARKLDKLEGKCGSDLSRRVGINKPSSYITCFYGEKAAYECSVIQHTYQRGVASGEKPYIENVGDKVNTMLCNQHLKDGVMDMAHDPISVDYISGFAPIQDRSRLPKVFRRLPPFSHYNSHPFLVDDFVRAVTTGKLPPNNAWDSARYMIPGLIAHQSALKNGELLDIPDCGSAPKDWEKITYDVPPIYENTDKFYEVKGYHKV